MGAEAQEAEFVTRLTLQGVSYILQITGRGAEHIAAMLQAAKNQPDNSPGKKRLATMLKSRESLKVFELSEENLEVFVNEAKRYGCQYCITKRSDENVKLGTYDILVREIDAARINHILQNLRMVEVEGSINTDVPEDKQKKAVELSEAQKVMQDMFSPNREERAVNERQNPQQEPTEEYQSEGYYRTTDDRVSIKEQLKEKEVVVESTKDMFRTARNLTVLDMMSPNNISDEEEEINLGWNQPEKSINEAGQVVYRGKTFDEMDMKEKLQYQVDEEMFVNGSLSDELTKKVFEAGYMIDEEGYVDKLEIPLTSRGRELVVEMMNDAEMAKNYEQLREAIANG